MFGSNVNKIQCTMFTIVCSKKGRSQNSSLLLQCGETLLAKDATILQERV